MANVYITEIADMANIGGHTGQVPLLPEIGGQIVAIGSEAKSQPFSSSARFVRLYADSVCHVSVGENPTASTGSTIKLGTGQTEYIGIGRGNKLSVVAGV